MEMNIPDCLHAIGYNAIDALAFNSFKAKVRELLTRVKDVYQSCH